METGLLLFARMDSSRLPGKALRALAGRPLLGRCIDRARLVPGGNRIVIATSDRPVDDSIADFARSEGVDCFRGSAADVAGRALACARHFGLGRFARICGDSPFFPEDVIGALLEMQDETGADVACNIHPRTYPPGASAEIIATKAMERLCAAPDLDESDREHCTQYFYRHPEAFRILNRAAPEPGWRAYTMAVDTPEDMARTEVLLDRLGADPATLPWQVIFDALRGRS